MTVRLESLFYKSVIYYIIVTRRPEGESKTPQTGNPVSDRSTNCVMMTKFSLSCDSSAKRPVKYRLQSFFLGYQFLSLLD